MTLKTYQSLRYFLAGVFTYLVVRSALGALGNARAPGPHAVILMGMGLAVALFYAVLGRALYVRPHRWGFGIGVFLVLLVAVSCALEFFTVQRLRAMVSDVHPPLAGFLVTQVLMLLAAVACFVVRGEPPAELAHSPTPTVSPAP